jgi:hypothetical protein
LVGWLVGCSEREKQQRAQSAGKTQKTANQPTFTPTSLLWLGF